MSQFLHDNDNAKAMAIPWVFYENSQAKNAVNILPQCFEMAFFLGSLPVGI